MRIDALKKKIASYIKKEQLMQSQEYTKLEKHYLAKSRKNLAIANLLLKISDTEEIKKILRLSADFETYDWAIIVAYYSMYISSLAALARLGFKSKSHTATIAVLEYNYVHQQKGLETKHLINLTRKKPKAADFSQRMKAFLCPKNPPVKESASQALPFRAEYGTFGGFL